MCQMIIELALFLSWIYIAHLWDRAEYRKGIIRAQKKRILELQGMDADMDENEVRVNLKQYNLN